MPQCFCQCHACVHARVRVCVCMCVRVRLCVGLCVGLCVCCYVCDCLHVGVQADIHCGTGCMYCAWGTSCSHTCMTPSGCHTAHKQPWILLLAYVLYIFSLSEAKSCCTCISATLLHLHLSTVCAIVALHLAMQSMHLRSEHAVTCVAQQQPLSST